MRRGGQRHLFLTEDRFKLEKYFRELSVSHSQSTYVLSNTFTYLRKIESNCSVNLIVEGIKRISRRG